MIDFEIDTGTGMTEAQRSRFTDRGMGISNLVRRATVRASELSPDELIEGGHRLAALVGELRPNVVAVAGVTAYRTAFADPSAQVGPMSHGDGPEWWILPNPSGLNAHVTIEGLADWFRQVGDSAGIV